MSINGFLDQNPFVRIVIPYALGIIAHLYVHIPGIVCVAAVCLFLLLAVFFYRRQLSMRFGWVTGLVLFVTLGVMGFATAQLADKPPVPHDVNNYKCNYRACVTNTPSEGERAYKVDLQVEAVKVFGEWQNFDTKIVATIIKDSLARQLKAGQTIIFFSKIDSLNAPKNPFGFDYSQYLQLNGVQGSIFLNQGEWQIANESVRGLKQHALNMRQKLVDILRNAGLSGNEFGLASTLVLGYKNSIDAEVKQAYMNAGAMHVLAVSGMHVGIVCSVLEFLMTLLGGRILLTLKRVIIILLLWAYAFITGLSPSVLRATVMFSFVMLARLINREMSIYNSLAASAFMLLCFDPSLLFKASFQLSYAAVTGIVFFQPRIAKLIRVRNKPLRYIWELTAVSIAAQISTLPFCLYYFERTPVYFWLSNVIVSPGAAVMIFLTMTLLAVSPVASLTKIVGFVTSAFAKAMNFVVMSIANLPFSTIENRYISVFQALLVAIAIISATIWIINHKPWGLAAALCSILLFIIPISANKLSACNVHAINVYYSPKSPSVQFVDGLRSYWTCNLYADNKKINTLVKGGNYLWNSLSFEKISPEYLAPSGQISFNNGFFKFCGINGLLIDGNTQPFEFSKADTLDLLIVTSEPAIKARQMPKNLSFKTVVIDASVPPWIMKDWERKFSKCQIHNVKKAGAFIWRLD